MIRKTKHRCFHLFFINSNAVTFYVIVLLFRLDQRRTIMKSNNTKPLADKEFVRDGRAPVPVNIVTSRVMRGNKSRDTGPEMKLRNALWANGMR